MHHLPGGHASRIGEHAHRPPKVVFTMAKMPCLTTSGRPSHDSIMTARSGGTASSGEHPSESRWGDIRVSESPGCVGAADGSGRTPYTCRTAYGQNIQPTCNLAHDWMLAPPRLQTLSRARLPRRGIVSDLRSRRRQSAWPSASEPDGSYAASR